MNSTAETMVTMTRSWMRNFFISGSLWFLDDRVQLFLVMLVIIMGDVGLTQRVRGIKFVLDEGMAI
jgi:hypothetical protein